MKILFFEIDAINVKRYYLDVLPEVIENSRVSILIENKEEKKVLNELGITLPVKVLQNLQFIELERQIEEVDILIINGQRIPDIMLTLIADKVGTKVLYLQHGMYIPYMKRGVSFFLGSMFKSLRYLKYATMASRVDKNFSLFIQLCRSHLVDGVRKYEFRNYDAFPDTSFVFSEYWEKWHQEHYFTKKYDRFRIVGNPELLRFEKEYYGAEFITYCYQTLIEDGRIEKEYLLNKIDEIIGWTKTNKLTLLVKGHPRMSSEVVEFFKERNVKVIKEKLPVTKIIIGHYSSLMPLWTYYGSNVYSINLKGHNNNIDESIKNTSILIENLDEIETYPKNLNEKLKNNVEYYFNYNPKYSDAVFKIINLI